MNDKARVVVGSGKSEIYLDDSKTLPYANETIIGYNLAGRNIYAEN